MKDWIHKRVAATECLKRSKKTLMCGLVALGGIFFSPIGFVFGGWIGLFIAAVLLGTMSTLFIVQANRDIKYFKKEYGL